MKETIQTAPAAFKAIDTQYQAVGALAREVFRRHFTPKHFAIEYSQTLTPTDQVTHLVAVVRQYTGYNPSAKENWPLETNPLVFQMINSSTMDYLYQVQESSKDKTIMPEWLVNLTKKVVAIRNQGIPDHEILAALQVHEQLMPLLGTRVAGY